MILKLHKFLENNNMENTELIKEIDTKLQFVIMLSIFFPTFLLVFLQGSGVGDQSLGKNIIWFFPVGLYLINYLFFTGIKNKKIGDRALKFLKSLVLVGVFVFVFPVCSLAVNYTGGQFSSWYEYFSFKISLYGLIIVPAFILVYLLLVTFWIVKDKIFKK